MVSPSFHKTAASTTVLSVSARGSRSFLLFDRGVNLGLLAWVAMFFSILIWQRSDLRPGELGDTTNYYRIVLVLSAACASVYALLRNGARLHQAISGPWLLLLVYALVAMISSLYIPTYAFYSMWKGFELLVDVLTIAAILTYPNPQDNARSAYRLLPFLYGVLVVVYEIEAALMPSAALTPSRGFLSVYMTGVLPVMTQNALAFLSAVTAFAIVCRLYRPGGMLVKTLYGVMLCLSLVTLILAQSRTSVAGLVLALLVFMLFDRRFLSLALLAGGCLLIAIYTHATDVSLQYLLRGQDAELVTTLSGRTQGWEAAWQAFKESPMLGGGFAAYARADILGPTGWSSLHGAVFDVMVGTGLLGLIPWTGAILWTLFRVFTMPMRGHPWFRSVIGRNVHAEMLGIFMLILVRASTSSGLAMHQDNFMLFLTVLAYATSVRLATRSSADQPVLLMAQAPSRG